MLSVTAVVVMTLMVNVIVLGDFNDELIVDPNGTTYDQLSCEEKIELRHDIDSLNFTDVSSVIVKMFTVQYLIFRWLNRKGLERTN